MLQILLRGWHLCSHSSAHTNKQGNLWGGIAQQQKPGRTYFDQNLLCSGVCICEPKLYQNRGSIVRSSHQLCKKITVSKHFTQHTPHSHDTSFKNKTICANELPCSSSCQRVTHHHVSCHSFYVNLSHHISVNPTIWVNIICVITLHMQYCHHTLFSKSR